MKSEQYLVLHGLAIKKYASADAVAGIMGLDPEHVASVLREATARGRVLEANGKYSLTPTTRIALASDYSRHCADLRESRPFAKAYEEFERVNSTLKVLITHWQTVDIAGSAITNDHADTAYDSRIIDRLGDLHERADRILAEFARHLPRLQIYRDKLSTALERAEDGALEWVSDAKIESYHTLWFELHEDLLCMLGRTRVE